MNVVGLAVFLSHEREASLQMMFDPLLLNPAARWQAQRTARRQETAPARWLAGAAFLLLLALTVRRLPDWGAAILGIGAMPLLFSLSCYYYSAFVVFAPLCALAAAPTVSLAALAWTTTAIAGIFPAEDERYVYQSLAVVVFAVVTTCVLARRHAPDSDRR